MQKVSQKRARVHDFPDLLDRLFMAVRKSSHDRLSCASLGIRFQIWWRYTGEKRFFSQERETQEAAEKKSTEKEKQKPPAHQILCQHCGNPTNGSFERINVETGSTPECPEGYGSEMLVCMDCFKSYMESLPSIPLTEIGMEIPVNELHGCDDLPW